MHIDILNKKRKKEIIEKIKKDYEFPKEIIKKLEDNQFFFTGKEKIRMFSGNIDLRNFVNINRQMNVQNIGLYFATIEQGFFRLSFDMLTIYGKYAEKNFIVLTDEQEKQWIQGNDIYIADEQIKKISCECPLIKTRKGEILSSGLIKNNIILNYLPKEVRNSIY